MKRLAMLTGLGLMLTGATMLLLLAWMQGAAVGAVVTMVVGLFILALGEDKQ